MSRRRHGHYLVLPVIIPAGWLLLGDPAGWHGEGAALGAGLIAAPFTPVLLLLALEAPGALVPARWRAWWRHGQPVRPNIRAWLRRAVYAADRYRCLYCRSTGDLQLDHCRPWSLGGRTSLLNLFTLCGRCNRVKSNYWRDRDGYVHYRPFHDHGDRVLAAAILRCERRNRWNLMRMIRAAASLGR